MIVRLLKISDREIKGLFYKKKSSIIVAGLGRSGTTLVYNSLLYNHYFKPTPFTTNLNSLMDYDSKGFVYKTHDLPPKELNDSFKLIYLFGNPMNTVLSTHRRINEWGRLHHKHLHSNLFKDNDDILYKDILMLNEHFDKWYRKQKFSFVSIKYEMLYTEDTQNALSDYLGFKIKLFPQKKRNTDWKTHPMGDIVYNTYKQLFLKIEESENYKIWEP